MAYCTSTAVTIIIDISWFRTGGVFADSVKVRHLPEQFLFVMDDFVCFPKAYDESTSNATGSVKKSLC